MGLLAGVAGLATVSTAAMAADAIVMADPEPVEYVRVCDVYGTGFYYIPGTETCLKVGGYLRYDIGFTPGGIGKLARFAPHFDARSETEIGTLRGYAEVELNWQQGERRAVDANGDGQVDFPLGVAYGGDFTLLHAYIQIVRPSGSSWMFGRSETPFTRFLGYGGPTMNDGYYGYRNAAEISYTFTGSNGFSFIAALVDDEDGSFIPDAEVGLNFARGWGSIGAIVGVDSEAPGGFGVGANLTLVLNFPNDRGFFKLAALATNNGGSAYGISGAAAGTEFSVLAGLNVAFTNKVGLGITGQWFSASAGAPVFAAISLPITPAENFTITPEVGFDGPGGYTGVANGIYGALRFQRSF